MITLPSAFITNFANRCVWFIRITVQDVGTTKYLYISSLDLSAFTIQYGGNTVTPRHDYLAALIADGAGTAEALGWLGETDVALAGTQFGMLSAINETALILLNQGDFAGSNAYDIENMAVEIWEGRLPASGTIEITTAFTPRFKGLCRNVGNYDYLKWRLGAVDRRYADSIPLPSRVVSLEEFPYAGLDAPGKALPTIFGDFQTDNTFGPGIQDVTPMVCIDKNIVQYQISDHQLFSYDKAFYKDSSGLIGTPYNTVTVTNAITGADIILATNVGDRRRVDLAAEARFYVMPVGFGAFCNGSTIDTGNFRNALDRNPSTGYNIANTSGVTVSVAFAQQNYAFQGVLRSFSGYTYEIHIECANRIGTIQVWYGRRKTAGTQLVGTLDADSKVFQVSVDGTNYPTWGWDEFYDTEVILNLANGASLDLKSIWWEVVARVPNIGVGSNVVSSSSDVRRTFGNVRTPPNPAIRTSAWQPYEPKVAQTNWFMSCKGVKTTAAMVSGRSNGYAAGDLIKNPAYAIEYILRERMSISDIDAASFDLVGNTTNGLRKDWEIAGVVADRSDALEILRAICQEFALQLILTARGSYRLVAMDSRTEDYTVQSSDIAQDSSTGPKINVDFTPNDQILNDVFLDYRESYVDGNPVASMYLSDTDGDGAIETNLSADSGNPRGTSYSTWFGDSRSRYGVSKPFRVVLRFIRKAATAELSLKKIADWNAFKRMKVNATLVRNTSTMRLEVGDVVKVNDDIVTAIHKNVTKFMVVRVNNPETAVVESADWIHLLLEEIPNANTGIPVTSSRWISAADLAVV
ncbi:MAG: hypothetical protein AB1428_13110 [Bacteroidota bacterium]